MKNQLKTALCLLVALCLLLSSGCSFSSPEEPVAETATEQDAASQLLECPVDLMDYMTQNMEVYAYIVVPGTGISYPVVQSRRDDNYYLRRDWKGNTEYSGCIFSQSGNTTEFTDPVTVLYGHNTGNGDMFSELLNYKDKSFFDENNIIIIYLPYGTLIYRIFSAHTFDDRHILNSYDFSDAGVLADFQQTLLDPPVMEKNTRSDTELGPDSHILTLSTCAEPRSGCSTRYLVNGVLINYVFEN